MAPKSNKKVTGKIKLQIEAGKANPSPPVGPALGQKGVNIMDFCKQFNERTASQAGYIIPVVIDVYEDRNNLQFKVGKYNPTANLGWALFFGIILLLLFLFFFLEKKIKIIKKSRSILNF